MMNNIEMLLVDVQAIIKFGYFLGEVSQKGDVICLDGDLGAGKTTLTQAIGKGMHTEEECYITSPSFSILHEYPGPVPLYHMDFYRLDGEEDVIAMGLDEYFYKGGVTVVEWAQKACNIYPDDSLYINLQVKETLERVAVCSCIDNSSWKKRLMPFFEKLSV